MNRDNLFPIVQGSPGIVNAMGKSVALIGFLQQGNLGLGYLSATLRKSGFEVELIDFEADFEDIYERLRNRQPIIVGFSLIFQFYLPRFAELVRTLRHRGVSCHFTMGGHFPSLSSHETLEAIPELDTVVRFEGEMTLLELADRVSTGRDWRDVPGIVYRDQGRLVQSAPRPLIHDLDELPYPDRNFEPEEILGHRAMPLLASRGCARTCSFCSIHTFYRAAPGKVVRTRRPAEVVREMAWLHRERGITIFLFQDDDFPLFGPAWKRWTRDLLGELHRANLPGNVVWKINCRADALDEQLFREMKDAGLYLVYMGLESGTEGGLATLNKGITVEQNIRAVELLKRLELMYEFGFMMFDPSSTFQSIRDNLNFLRTITEDGSAAAIFCRMLPYDGTPIKDELLKAGRLRGDVSNPEYDFLDPRIDAFYELLNKVMKITGWIHGHPSLSLRLNWAWNEISIIERLFPRVGGIDEYKTQLREITKASNAVLYSAVEEFSYVFSEGRSTIWDATRLSSFCHHFLNQLTEARDGFILKNQIAMLASLPKFENVPFGLHASAGAA